MYIVPGYVDYYEDNGVIYVTSNLRQNTVKLTDPQIIEEFRNVIRCGGCPELTTSLANFLHEQELLVNSKEIEDSINELRELMGRSLFLTIMPTEGCNFRCPYCYEDHSPISMRRKTLDKIHDYLIEQVSKYTHVGIGWFGGEPTLCKDIILETSNLVQSLQKKYPFTYNSSMTTNAYLLGLDDFVQYYHAGITSYQITLDGWTHDQTRPHVTGKGTLQRILDNLIAISSLPQEEYQYNITIRHNILPGDEDFSWYDYLRDLFGNDCRFTVLVRPVSDWGGDSVKSLNVLSGEALNEHMRKHVEYLNKIGMQCENGKKDILSQICYAYYPHSMVFRANGKIEKCTVCLDHPKNLLGVVDPDKGVTINEDVNKLWSESALTSECYKCKDVLSCLNKQCRMSAIINEDEIFRRSCELSDIF